ncbi:hypothetical protein CJJ09_005388 [Candidozyma auris]|nr:hypothetical protein CJJ09_005388 [[Candida] auris]
MYPDESSFLTPKERRFITHKIKHSSNAENMKIVATAVPEKSLGEDNASDKSQVWAVLKDWQSWTQLMICYGTLVPLYAMSLFGPTIIYSLGYTSTEAQLLGVPVYALASGWCVFQAWLSDRVGLRAPFMIFDILCIVTGFSVLLGFNTITNPGSQYAAMYVIGIGCAAYPLVVIWLSNNLAGSYKRAIGMAFQIGLGNFSGAFSSNFYRQQDAPQYNLGHALCLGFAVMGLLFSLIAVSGYMYCNKKRRREVAQVNTTMCLSKSLSRWAIKVPTLCIVYSGRAGTLQGDKRHLYGINFYMASNNDHELSLAEYQSFISNHPRPDRVGGIGYRVDMPNQAAGASLS